MLFRIERINLETKEKEYEYVCGKRALANACIAIMQKDDMTIDGITSIAWSWKAFKVCLAHTISKSPNQTAPTQAGKEKPRSGKHLRRWGEERRPEKIRFDSKGKMISKLAK